MSLVWLALFCPDASALVPSDAVHIGIEPHRTQVKNPEVQARYLRSEGWERFVATDGHGWRAVFDEATGTPRTLWGTGIPVDTTSADTVADDVQAVLDRHATLLGFEAGDLRLVSANHVARIDTWYVQFDALRDGLPTYRAGLSARVKHGNLILVHCGTSPAAPVTGALDVTPNAAIDAAIATGPAPTAEHTEHEAMPVLLERWSKHGLELRRTWQTHTRTYDPPGIWVSFVDGETGELLSVHNEVRFASGTVTALHHERTLDGSPLIESPMVLAAVAAGNDLTYTDENGDFTIPDDNTYLTDMESGDYLSVQNNSGGEGLISSSNPDMTWDSGEATQAEIDSYVFLHQIKLWGERVAPEVGMVWDPITSTVNIPDVCNAYYDGNVNFFSAGGGCNNTGQIADVNYHEWGHGFHGWSLQAGIWDGSVGEGAGDITSFLQTGDNIMAPWFGTTGWGIRDVGPNARYPDDYGYYVHENGLIFGGAMWDLWDALVDSEGTEAGTATTEQIFAGILKGGPDIPGTFFEALVADDNDGDLGNGTPHTCEIYEAFDPHGLGPGPGDTVVIANHEAPALATPDLDIDLEMELIEVSGGCEGGDPAFGEVHYRVNGGDWQSAGLSAQGSNLVGAIPGQKEGTFVDYYLTGEDVSGEDFAAPAGMHVNPYSVFVGGVIEIQCADFEAGDGGFTHELLSGEVQDGADDWQWGSPTGASGDPSMAWSGSNVWGNDLGHENFNGAYQPDKVNRLTSPTVQTEHYTDVFLQYRRWLQIEDASYDQATITANGTPVWTNWAGFGEEHHLDGDWAHHAVDLGGLGDRGPIQIAWELSTDGGLEMGGWTIDDVCIVAAATADNRLAILDFAVEALSDTHVGLSWTHPIHDPVSKVQVVRRLDRFPTGPEDGKIVFTDDAPVAGAAMEHVDPAYDEGRNFYAIYGFDGSEWLSWTIEGWNADDTTLVGGVPPTGGLPPGADGGIDGKQNPEYGKMGCACDAGAVPAAGWLAALLPLLILRRRG